MKRILLLLTFVVFLLPTLANAQSFSMQDTVTATIDTSNNVNDYITIGASTSQTLKWHVVATNFPADWLTEAALGICDNSTCYYNTGTGAGDIWNAAAGSGNTFTTSPYAPGITNGAYHLVLDLTGTSCGTHYLTVGVSDITALGSQTATFIITHTIDCTPSGIANIPNTESNVLLYPNPATNELNVVYDASSDVKNIAVYNIIGKVMTVYKVTANNSANLDIENLPSGIYFVRLMNSHGDVVVTRKFTKQ